MWSRATDSTRKAKRFLLLNPATSARFKITCHRILLAVAVLSVGVVSATPAQTQSSDDTLATLSTVYVASAGASWFSTWLEEKEQSEGSLFRPKIKVLSGKALLQQVAADGASIGLMSKSELRAAASSVSGMRSAQSGLQVCLAIAVRADAVTAETGDLALLPQSAKIVATNDTIEIVRSLLEVHHFGQRLSVSVSSVSQAITGLTSGTVAVAALPVEPDGGAQISDAASNVRYLELSDAAAKATAGDSFTIGSFSTNRVLGVPLASSIRTVCDDIMIVSSSSGQFPPERLGRKDDTSAGQVEESDGLLARAKTSLDDLWNVIIAKYQGLGQ